MSGEQLYWDDETLDLVVGALMKTGLSQEDAREAINEMQNAGILFRERWDNNRRRELIEKAREG